MGSEGIICPNCGRESAPNAQLCYNCGADLAADPQEFVAAVAAGGATPARAKATPLNRRYDDAYVVSRTIIGLGSIVKVLAYVIGGLIALSSLIAAGQASESVVGTTAGIGGLVTAAAVGTSLFVLGVLVSAVGQILRATLDTAVNTSPLLGDDEKSRIIAAA